jgi:hypothetical protein
MTHKTTDKKITLQASLEIPLGELATYLLKKGEEPSNLLNLLYKSPEIVNYKIKKLVREILRDKKSKVRLQDLAFDYNDSDRFSHGASYFKVSLRGTKKELRRVAGANRTFYFDWEEREKENDQ